MGGKGMGTMGSGMASGMAPKWTEKVDKHFDVLIMGAGVAGVSQARHLQMWINYPKIANLSICLVDPRSDKRNDMTNDLKVGESLVDVSALFFTRDLGLYDYMLENHAFKYGLQFHWPRDPAKTDTMDDYIGMWVTQNPIFQSFQIHRAKLEADMLKMATDDGAQFIRGWITDVHVTKGDADNYVRVKTFDGQSELTLSCKYLCDAAGRNLILGRACDNALKEPKDVYGLENAATWLRVKNFDLKYFESPFNPDRTSVSFYYNTNHFLGVGHWVWMIPIETRNGRELSIGASFHRSHFDYSTVNTIEGFMGFLKSNHKILYDIIMSGEIMDFHKLPREAHTSKTFISEDNWSVLGDAAAVFDPFYSNGLVITSYMIITTTEVVKHKFIKCPSLEYRRNAYNKMLVMVSKTANHLISNQNRTLGHASAMSNRIYFESITLFGVVIPFTFGRYLKDPLWAERIAYFLTFSLEFREEVHQLLLRVVEENLNIGFMDVYTAGHLVGDFCPHDDYDIDGYRRWAKFEERRLDIWAHIKWTNFYLMCAFLRISYKGFGLKQLMQPTTIRRAAICTRNMIAASIGSLFHKWKFWGVPENNWYKQRDDSIYTNYKYSPTFQPYEPEPIDPAYRDRILYGDTKKNM